MPDVGPEGARDRLAVDAVVLQKRRSSIATIACFMIGAISSDFDDHAALRPASTARIVVAAAA